MRTAEKTRKPQLLKYFLSALLPVLLLCLFYFLTTKRDAINSVQEKFSLPALRFLGKTFSAIPVSILEIFIAAAVIAAIVYIFKFISALLSFRRAKTVTILRFLLILVIILAWIWNGYCWLWNAGYYADSFAEKAGLETVGISTDDLYNAAKFFCEQANALSYLVPRDDDGIFCGGFEYFAESYDTLYAPIDEEFPFLAGQTTMPKGVFFSKIMSYMGYTGLFFPFSGETYINTDQPAWDIPNTIAHEIAHQRGVHFEAEANFIGIAACIQSDELYYRYSGYMAGLIHLTNALYTADPERYWELRDSFSAHLEADWQDNNRYWQEKEGKLNEVADMVYDTFLQVNNQPSGLQSYGECVDLLVLWLNTSAYSPMEG
ncbi:MAG: DUF3810 domain-containing protein [Oscillospiraceae bacterium]|nr:DUF3810 domain-containing protein [Oscillospiraceae bacterium]